MKLREVSKAPWKRRTRFTITFSDGALRQVRHGLGTRRFAVGMQIQARQLHGLPLAVHFPGAGEGIPARFEIGFPVPGAAEGAIPGYHCWAEFFLDGVGWVPVDISEAWKDPKKHDYFFGTLDADRVHPRT